MITLTRSDCEMIIDVLDHAIGSLDQLNDRPDLNPSHRTEINRKVEKWKILRSELAYILL